MFSLLKSKPVFVIALGLHHNSRNSPSFYPSLALFLINNFVFKAYFVQGSGSLQQSKDMGSKGFSATMDNTRTSIHSTHITEVHNVPMRVITRPIPPVLDEDKVLSLMETIQVR